MPGAPLSLGPGPGPSLGAAADSSRGLFGLANSSAIVNRWTVGYSVLCGGIDISMCAIYAWQGFGFAHSRSELLLSLDLLRIANLLYKQEAIEALSRVARKGGRSPGECSKSP